MKESRHLTSFGVVFWKVDFIASLSINIPSSETFLVRRYSRRHIMQHKSRQTDRQLPVSSSPCRRYEKLRISGVCAYTRRKVLNKIGDYAPNMTTPQLKFVTTCASVNVDYRRGCPLYAGGDCFFVRNKKLTYSTDHRWY